MELTATDPSGMTSEMVAIRLEDEEEPFYVEKALLCRASPYFTAALEGSFKEAREGVLTLPGCDRKTLELFLNWTLHHYIPEHLITMPDGLYQEQDHFKASELQVMLVRLWCFADSVIMPALQDTVMNFLRRCLRKIRSCDVHPEAFKTLMALAPTVSALHGTMIKHLADKFYDEATAKTIKKEDKEQLAAIPGLMDEVMWRVERERAFHENLRVFFGMDEASEDWNCENFDYERGCSDHEDLDDDDGDDGDGDDEERD